METLLAKKQELEKELADSVINIEDVEKKVAEYRESLLKQLQEDNEEKTRTIKIKLAFIDELINDKVLEAEAKAKAVTENTEEVVAEPILQINPEALETTENVEEQPANPTIVEEKNYY